MSDLAAYSICATSGLSEQEKLINEHATLVKRIAYHLMSRLPASVQIDDLIQAGMIGLLEAARNYDVSQGASFETYAGIRIRGSMLDEIRKGDWAPRSLHRKVRDISRVMREIEVEKGRDARESEVAERLDMTLQEYQQVLQDANSHQILSFEDIPTGDENIADGMSANIPGPVDSLETDDLKRVLTEAVTSLPERERMVMSLYYDEELNLRETGEVMGVSESRVCQIHSQAMIRLRAKIEWMIDEE